MTVVYLIKPLLNKDWIKTNEIVNTAKRQNMIFGFWTMGLLFILAIAFALYETRGGGATHTLENGSVANFGLVFGIFIFVGIRWLPILFFSAAYENLLQASNQNYFANLAKLAAEILVYMFIIGLLVLKVYPLVPFLIFFLAACIRSYLVVFYVKRHFLWLNNYYRKFNKTLIKNAFYATVHKIGIMFLLSSDIIIIYLILGFRVGSLFTFYSTITITIRLLMINLMQAWRCYYALWIADEGRLYAKDFKKLDFFAFLLASFAFINQFISSPYILNAIYNGSANDIMHSEAWSNQQRIIYENIFLKPTFSLLMGLVAALAVISEPFQMLIFAKKKYSKTAWVTLGFGIMNVVLGLILCSVFSAELHSYIWALYSTVIVEIVLFSFYYCYLWVYNWFYLSYSSAFFSSIRNWILLLGSIIVATLIIYLLVYPSNIGYGRFGSHSLSSRVSTWRISYLLMILFIILGLSFVTIGLLFSLIFIDKIFIYLIQSPKVWKLRQRFNIKKHKLWQAKYGSILIGAIPEYQPYTITKLFKIIPTKKNNEKQSSQKKDRSHSNRNT